ncbi:molybdopterin cofactor-binding domain-containing protein [Congregibacter variabilis]|uniref:Molybdopterin cofactor-binding domain-containing protein n=1 Tax=Congregibacter variabilis TaxID=3081200 RepID=A0ABZ0I1Z1_9GAMM|nr:molybdopterin cofactor-binding domain-containing protein [Congregibacter sp. IMCC43200]
MKSVTTGVSRRSFLAGSLGTGLMMGLGVVLPGCSKEEAVSEIVATGGSQLFSPAVWFEINEAGEVLVNIAKAEMGQHVGTALARIVADELGADWDSVSLAHVDTDPKWGYMVTGGSWSVVTSFEMLSRAGAAGRTVLIDAAAKLLDVDATQLSAENGVVSGAGQSLSFAEIVSRGDISRSFSEEELAAMPIKPAAARTLIGKTATALDVPAKSRGAAVYGLDAELPGMVYAHPIVAPTRYGSVITAIDDSAAKAIPGYQQTLAIEDSSGFVQGMALVIADSFPAAMKATDAVKVEWDLGETASVSEDDILAEGKALVDDPSSGVLFVDAGDTSAAMSSASDTLSATYRTSTALHFTLEPQNALVEFQDGQCHVHAGNQWQSLIIPTLAQSLDMEEKDIVLHTYYLGGGFGRRLFGDQMIPAAHAARQLGKPVKLIMTRPADSLFDCARSPSVARLDAAFAEDGSLSAIEHAAAAGWPTLSMAPGFLGEGVDGKGKFDGFSINGSDHWYSVANHRVRAINNTLAQKTFLPGWLRSVGPGWIGWGVECFMDEIAAKLGVDPLEYRLSLLDAAGRQAGSAPMQVGGASRLAAVLQDVRERSGWGSPLPEGEALGVAVAHGQERAMPTWSACVAHVAVDGKNVTVKKLWQTLDCGTVVHPDGAMAQAEGASLWGLSLALHEGTAFENGQVRDRNLDTYKPLRMADVPELDIKFIQSDEFPTGLGEPPLIAVAPAIGNAVFAATGQRVRDLPIRL